MGSKCRIREWLINIFPKYGRIYLEPFAGNANVYFSAVEQTNYNKYILNDKYSHKFLNALKVLDIQELPIKLGDTFKEEIKHCLNHGKEFSDLQLVVESLITFGGKGYNHGFGDLNRYKKDKIQSRICKAKLLLEFASILPYDYAELDYSDLGKHDFIYFDPPYYSVKSNGDIVKASYNNINHYELIEVIDSLKCKWALSGYDNYVYRDNLKYKNKYTINRNSEIKGSVTGKREEVEEILWTNF